MKKIYITSPKLPNIDSYKKGLGGLWKSKKITNKGEYTLKLEDVLAKKLKVNNLSLFCNGTIALLTALKALDLKGEVITTPFTFPATVTSLEWLGLKPVFVDIDEETMCIDPKKNRRGYNAANICNIRCACLRNSM